MMLIETSEVPASSLPLDALKQHLRLGAGFAEDDLQDEMLRSFLRAAMAAIEGRIGKALIARSFLWTVQEWSDPAGVVFPVAPVQSLVDISVTDRQGASQPGYQDACRFVPDLHAPRLMPQATSLPGIPSGGSAAVAFTAGYGESLAELPQDLGQAVLLLAAHYYEYRGETSLGEGCMPFGVTSLISRFRPLRMGFGS